MALSRRLGLAAIVLASGGACAREAPVHRPPPTAVVSDPPPAARDAVPASFPTIPPELPAAGQERMCAIARYDHEVRAAVAGQLPSAAAKFPLGECFAGPNGVWSLSLEIALAAPVDRNVTGLAVVHVDRRDRVVRQVDGIWGPEQMGEGFAEASPGDVAVHAFDFDGDGDVELYIHWLTFTATTREDAAQWSDSVLLGFRTGAIGRYGPAAKLSLWGFEDVDKDGRPDLWTTTPYGGRQRYGAFDDYVWGPRLLAHALPDGSFSTTDPVAIAEARKVCPKKPTARQITKPDDELHGTTVNVACARLWGMPADAIRKLFVGRELPSEVVRVLAVEPPLLLK